jgi:hypothetical protein
MIVISVQAYQRKKVTFPEKNDLKIYGVPETIRTSGPFLRREVLYPAELRGQNRPIFIYQVLLFGKEFSAAYS